MSSAEGALSSIQQSAALHSTQLVALQLSNSSLQSASMSLSSRVSLAEGSLTSAAQANALQAAQITALQLANYSLQTAAAALNVRISAAEASQVSLSQSGAMQDMLIAALQSSNSSLQAASMSLSSRMSGAEADLSSVVQTASQQSTLLSVLQASNRSSVEYSLALAAQVAALQQVLLNSNASLSSAVISLAARSSALELQEAAANTTVASLALRIVAVEQIQPSLQPTLLYSTLVDLRNAAGQSQLVTSVKQMTGWIGALNRTTAAICNLPSSSCNLCFPLVVTIIGGGSVLQSPTGCQAGRFVAGLSVTLNAAAAFNYTFFSWSPLQEGNEISIVMPASSYSITATFLYCYVLTIVMAGGGSSTVTTYPSSSSGCLTGRFISGDPVQVIESPATDFIFTAWSGVSTSTAASIYINMPAAASTLTANFVPCYSLSVTVASGGGSGTLSVTPSNSVGCTSGKFQAGASVQITATVTAPSIFWAWTGVLSSYSSATVTYTMPASTASATVQFALQCTQGIISTSSITITTARILYYQIWGG
jgi:hypothetical protein